MNADVLRNAGMLFECGTDSAEKLFPKRVCLGIVPKLSGFAEQFAFFVQLFKPFRELSDLGIDLQNFHSNLRLSVWCARMRDTPNDLVQRLLIGITRRRRTIALRSNRRVSHARQVSLVKSVSLAVYAICNACRVTERSSKIGGTFRVRSLTGSVSEEWTKWSDREIAGQCTVDHGCVSRLRPLSVDKPQIGKKFERGGFLLCVDKIHNVVKGKTKVFLLSDQLVRKHNRTGAQQFVITSGSAFALAYVGHAHLVGSRDRSQNTNSNIFQIGKERNPGLNLRGHIEQARPLQYQTQDLPSGRGNVRRYFFVPIVKWTAYCDCTFRRMVRAHAGGCKA